MKVGDSSALVQESFEKANEWSKLGVVLYIDAGNRFYPYYFYQVYNNSIEAKQVLSKILVSRPFTIYQLRQLVLDLDSAILETRAQSSIISLLTHPFSDEDVDADEREAILGHVCEKLKSLSQENVLVTLGASRDYWNKKVLEGLDWVEPCQVTE